MSNSIDSKKEVLDNFDKKNLETIERLEILSTTYRMVESKTSSCEVTPSYDGMKRSIELLLK